MDDPDPDVSLKAAGLLLDRVLGKPTESVALDMHQTADPAAVLPLHLDADDVLALERVRAKMTGPETSATCPS